MGVNESDPAGECVAEAQHTTRAPVTALDRAQLKKKILDKIRRGSAAHVNQTYASATPSSDELTKRKPRQMRSAAGDGKACWNLGAFDVTGAKCPPESVPDRGGNDEDEEDEDEICVLTLCDDGLVEDEDHERERRRERDLKRERKERERRGQQQQRQQLDTKTDETREMMDQQMSAVPPNFSQTSPQLQQEPDFQRGGHQHLQTNPMLAALLSHPQEHYYPQQQLGNGFIDTVGDAQEDGSKRAAPASGSANILGKRAVESCNMQVAGDDGHQREQSSSKLVSASCHIAGESDQPPSRRAMRPLEAESASSSPTRASMPASKQAKPLTAAEWAWLKNRRKILAGTAETAKRGGRGGLVGDGRGAGRGAMNAEKGRYRLGASQQLNAATSIASSQQLNELNAATSIASASQALLAENPSVQLGTGDLEAAPLACHAVIPATNVEQADAGERSSFCSWREADGSNRVQIQARASDEVRSSSAHAGARASRLAHILDGFTSSGCGVTTANGDELPAPSLVRVAGVNDTRSGARSTPSAFGPALAAELSESYAHPAAQPENGEGDKGGGRELGLRRFAGFAGQLGLDIARVQPNLRVERGCAILNGAGDMHGVLDGAFGAVGGEKGKNPLAIRNEVGWAGLGGSAEIGGDSSAAKGELSLGAVLRAAGGKKEGCLLGKAPNNVLDSVVQAANANALQKLRALRVRGECFKQHAQASNSVEKPALSASTFFPMSDLLEQPSWLSTKRGQTLLSSGRQQSVVGASPSLTPRTLKRNADVLGNALQVMDAVLSDSAPLSVESVGQLLTLLQDGQMENISMGTAVACSAGEADSICDVDKCSAASGQCSAVSGLDNRLSLAGPNIVGYMQGDVSTSQQAHKGAEAMPRMKSNVISPCNSDRKLQVDECGRCLHEDALSALLHQKQLRLLTTAARDLLRYQSAEHTALQQSSHPKGSDGHSTSIHLGAEATADTAGMPNNQSVQHQSSMLRDPQNQHKYLQDRPRNSMQNAASKLSAEELLLLQIIRQEPKITTWRSVDQSLPAVKSQIPSKATAGVLTTPEEHGAGLLGQKRRQVQGFTVDLKMPVAPATANREPCSKTRPAVETRGNVLKRVLGIGCGKNAWYSNLRNSRVGSRRTASSSSTFSKDEKLSSPLSVAELTEDQPAGSKRMRPYEEMASGKEEEPKRGTGWRSLSNSGTEQGRAGDVAKPPLDDTVYLGTSKANASVGVASRWGREPDPVAKARFGAQSSPGEHGAQSSQGEQDEGCKAMGRWQAPTQEAILFNRPGSPIPTYASLASSQKGKIPEKSVKNSAAGKPEANNSSASGGALTCPTATDDNFGVLSDDDEMTDAQAELLLSRHLESAKS